MEKASRFEMRLSEKMAQKIDAMRMGREDFPSRAQIVREAVEAAYAAKEKTPEAGTSRVL